MLAAPEPLPQIVHVPAGLEPWMRSEAMALLARSQPRLITGCVLSGLLSARYDHLPPTLGLIDRATALKHVEALDALGFEAAPLHLDDTMLDERIVADFRSRFGDAPRPDPSASGAPNRGPVEGDVRPGLQTILCRVRCPDRNLDITGTLGDLSGAWVRHELPELSRHPPTD